MIVNDINVTQLLHLINNIKNRCCTVINSSRSWSNYFSCCFRSHWTLYDINLKRNFIQHYDSLIEDASRLKKIVSAIKERLINIMKEWERSNRNFITVDKISENFYLCIFSFRDRWNYADVSIAKERFWL